ncbi:hypothetical protein J437_LFUL013834 [Ladona fulva]|uniref:Chitin-binding type-4 domain-containing protein n=1 Tax=Ladona fulva TaxID=123851 RepID=A0A8K0KGD0_LADFU|nr:hypothetical protein J437_LFUL013834 [Ladona fulva]
MFSRAWILPLMAALMVSEVRSHGRLMKPLQRSSLWRGGYDAPTNFNDNELFCGGFDVQYGKNDGKCGECGDPWQLPRPRPNELGGEYGLGIITENYTAGDTVELAVELTTNHWGYFEFHLCPVGPEEMVTQECLDKYKLKTIPAEKPPVFPQAPIIEDGYRWYVPTHDRGFFYVKTELPADVRCDRCVIQWTYTTATRWGQCDDGTSALGCGPQETFQNCADIHIQ